MYLGFYSSICTTKNQLTFPTRLLSQTGKDLLITTWFENSLIIVPKEFGSELVNKSISEFGDLLPEARDLQRFLFGNATEITLDKKNRFVLPKVLKEYSRIGHEAIFIGVSNRIELWDREVYDNYGKIREAQIRETAIQLYNRVSQLKIK